MERGGSFSVFCRIQGSVQSTQAQGIHTETVQQLAAGVKSAAIQIPCCGVPCFHIGAGVAVRVVGRAFLKQSVQGGFVNAGESAAALSGLPGSGQQQGELSGGYLIVQNAQRITDVFQRLHGAHRHRRLRIRVGGDPQYQSIRRFAEGGIIRDRFAANRRIR